MEAVQYALNRTHSRDAAPLAAPRILVAGAGGVLGSAVLSECLVAGRAAQVLALVATPLASTMRGLRPLRDDELCPGSDLADLAFIVLERERRSNRRDDAFARPDPTGWLPLARRIHAAGVPRLVLLLPHSPALLPRALLHGLASHDEGELARLGFAQLLIVRAARAGEDPSATPQSLAERLGQAWWRQLRFMVPEREQALTTPVLARCVVHLALQPPTSPAGSTLVLSPEALWQASRASPRPG